jgi:D-3-phosphoglycerate dehydrogenase
MLSKFTTLCSEQGINIENMTSKSRGDVAFTLLDVNGIPAESSIDALKALDAVLRVRVI